MRSRVVLGLIGVVALLGLGGFAAYVATDTDVVSAATTVRTLKLAAAGDICGSCQPTSDLIIAQNPRLVLTLGDNAYNSGTLAEYNSKYAPNWGRFKTKTQPSPGNHEWETANAQGYRDYFGLGSGPLYGSFTKKQSWHFVRLDTDQLSSTAQENWMQADLAADMHQCEIVYGHHPRWSSGSTHGSNSEMTNAWNISVANNVDIWLVGHEHNYERVYRDGIRQFVVGTGGGSHYPFGAAVAGSEFRLANVYGVLFLTLKSTGTYTWQFRDTAGTIRDSGSGVCH